MITVEAWTTIRYLHAQGKSVRSIASELSLSRNTVRCALRCDAPPRYSRPARPNPKLAPFAEQIREMLVQKQFIGTRIFRELGALGYTGGRTALYSYLAELKGSLPDSRLTERFETPPARQAQFDWSPYTIMLGGQMVRVIVFCLTLAFSRRKFYWPSLNETQASIFEAIEAGLRHFGGSPKELLVDNPRALVSNANPATFAWNPRFLELCGHYCIQPVACHPARPRTKGKVERPFFYLEQHFIKGNSWNSFDDFAAALARFTAEELDQMVHSTTQEPPIERFEQEKTLLSPLPALPFVSTREEMRKVSWDCLISFEGSRYSVPWQYASKQVWLRPGQGRALTVLSQKGEEIARHTLSAKKGATIINRDHYQGLRQGLPKTRILLEELFLRHYPEHQWFCEALFIQHKSNACDHLRAILGLGEVYSKQALLLAFQSAKECNTYSHRFVRGVLEAGSPSDKKLASEPPTGQLLSIHSSGLHPNGQVGADLGVYQRVLEVNR
jgi:transposase